MVMRGVAVRWRWWCMVCSTVKIVEHGFLFMYTVMQRWLSMVLPKDRDGGAIRWRCWGMVLLKIVGGGA
jgi:hypothetical protein